MAVKPPAEPEIKPPAKPPAKPPVKSPVRPVQSRVLAETIGNESKSPSGTGREVEYESGIRAASN